MTIYILFYLSIFLLLKAEKYSLFRKFNFYLLAYVGIFIFSAIRFDVGYDYMYYYSLLTKNIDFYDEMFNRLEYLNRGIITFSQELKFPQLYFIITSFLILALTYRTIKSYSLDFTISTLIFLSFPIFYFNSLSIIRQYVAVTIIFYGYRYVIKRDIYSFALIVLIAFFFHKSALIGILLYFIYKRKIKTIFYLIIFFLGFISSDLAYLLVEQIFPQYLSYMDRKLGTGGDKLLIFFQLIGAILLIFVNAKKENYHQYNFYLTSFYLGLFIWSSLAEYGHAGFRGALYFMVFSILLIPEIIEMVRQRKLAKQIIYIICFVFFVLTLVLGKMNPNKDPNIPYRVYFITDKSEFKK